MYIIKHARMKEYNLFYFSLLLLIVLDLYILAYLALDEYPELLFPRKLSIEYLYFADFSLKDF